MNPFNSLGDSWPQGHDQVDAFGHDLNHWGAGGQEEVP